MFRFKQFTIQQDRTAMKVCTDACVLGAYANVAEARRDESSDSVKRILDIGTGTGLLALMAAQRNDSAVVDAVEIDEAAFSQATENVAASPFSSRVNVIRGRIQEYAPDVLYDRILTNPPFYTNHLRSPDAAVNRALHTDELPFEELISAVARLLTASGQWWVLLPPYEAGRLAEIARNMGLYPFQRLLLRHHDGKLVFRVIAGFSFDTLPVSEEILTIYEQDGRTYTAEFKALLQDFYLIF